MLRVLSVCLYVVLVGVFLIYYDRIAAFLVELFFSFVNEHLAEPVEMVSFPPSIFGLRVWVRISVLFFIYCSNIL